MDSVLVVLRALGSDVRICTALSVIDFECGPLCGREGNDRATSWPSLDSRKNASLYGSRAAWNGLESHDEKR